MSCCGRLRGRRGCGSGAVEPLRSVGGKTIVDDYLREVRGRFNGRCIDRARSARVLCGMTEPVPVGYGQNGGVSGGRAGVFPGRRWGVGVPPRDAGCSAGRGPELVVTGRLPPMPVWDREGCWHGGAGQPAQSLAAFCGQPKVGWRFCERSDPQAKCVVERLRVHTETNFEPGDGPSTTWTSSCSWTRGLRRATCARTRRCIAVRATGLLTRGDGRPAGPRDRS
jgi:hypothetical protein